MSKASDYTDTAIEQGVVEFAVKGERYMYRNRGAGMWSRYDFGGGCFVHMAIISAPADATPRQLHAARESA